MFPSRIGLMLNTVVLHPRAAQVKVPSLAGLMAALGSQLPQIRCSSHPMVCGTMLGSFTPQDAHSVGSADATDCHLG